MENKIKLVMNDDKSINIFCNDDLKKTIKENDREISAEEIYDILDYKRGDSYNIITENEKVIDKPVLSFFQELFENISVRINDLNKSEVDDEEETQD